MSKEFVSKPCPHCPFRRDVTPFLTTERAEELAFNAANPYGSFPCHKTTVEDDYSDEGEMMVVETTKECAGHLTLQHHENGSTFYDDDGFKPAENCYSEAYEMLDAYAEHNGDDA